MEVLKTADAPATRKIKLHKWKGQGKNKEVIAFSKV